MADAILPDEQVVALAEARELRRRYEEQGKFPLVWVARERITSLDGIRRLRYVVKTFMRAPEKQRATREEPPDARSIN